MLQKTFKIYDGRNNFWQWDTQQKLIVLDDRITEVRFSSKDMRTSKRRLTYIDRRGTKVCDVPDLLLQNPKNLIAYACVQNEDGSCSTVSTVTFAVRKQQCPTDYTYEDDSVLEDILAKIAKLENSITGGTQGFIKFNNIDDATEWAAQKGESGDIIAVKIDSKWVPHIVEDDFSLSPINGCDYNDDTVVMTDYTNGNKYTLYVDNGKLTMEVV